MTMVFMVTSHKQVEPDSDGKGKNEGVFAMSAIESSALEGAQVRLICIQYVSSMLDMLKP